MARIFVVEDDAALRGELMRLLELQGHVALASTAFDRIADEALAADPDCVLLDLKLPGDGGHADTSAGDELSAGVFSHFPLPCGRCLRAGLMSGEDVA